VVRAASVPIWFLAWRARSSYWPATIRVLQGATLNLSTLHRTLAACLFWLKCAVLTRRRPLPVFPDKLTFLASVGISQTCTKLTRCEALEKMRSPSRKGRNSAVSKYNCNSRKASLSEVFAASPIGDHRVLFAHRRGGLVLLSGVSKDNLAEAQEHRWEPVYRRRVRCPVATCRPPRQRAAYRGSGLVQYAFCDSATAHRKA
jgi:hypothetical protein